MTSAKTAEINCPTQQSHTRNSAIVATITKFSDQVIVRRAGKWVYLSKKKPHLYTNDKVVTRKGMASVEFSDCSTIKLMANSHLKLLGSEQTTHTSTTSIRTRILLGSLHYNSKQSNSAALIVETPSSVINFQGKRLILGSHNRVTYGVKKGGKWAIKGSLKKQKPPQIKQAKADSNKLLQTAKLAANRQAALLRLRKSRAGTDRSLKGKIILTQIEANAILASAQEALQAAKAMQRNADSGVVASTRQVAISAKKAISLASKALKSTHEATKNDRTGKKKAAMKKIKMAKKLAHLALKTLQKDETVDSNSAISTAALRMTGIAVTQPMVIQTAPIIASMPEQALPAYSTIERSTQPLRMSGIATDQPMVIHTTVISATMSSANQAIYATVNLSTQPLRMTGITVEAPMVIQTTPLNARFAND